VARPINVTITGDYSDRDVKRAIKDLQSLQKQGPRTSKAVSGISSSLKGFGAGLAASFGISAITGQLQALAQAAAEDQKSVVALSKALQNVGLGAAADEAESFVEQLMLATGVSDTDLRGSLQTLTTATGDFEQSQRLVQVAMDASAATGRDLATVSLAIAKASQGNVGALTRLGIPLDANIVKAKDFTAALDVMESRFRGQAAAAAETYAGKMQRVTMAVGEAQEAIGYELLDTLDEFARLMGGTDGVVGLTAEAGENIANSIRPVRELAEGFADLNEYIQNVTGGLDFLGSWRPTGIFAIAGAWMDLGEELNAADEAQGAFSEHLGDIKQRLMGAAQDAGILGRDYEVLSDDTDKVARSTIKATTALERLQGQMDKMRANRSIAGQRLNLAQQRAEGPGKDGNLREFGLDYADQASSLAFDIMDRGGKGSKASARRVLANAREYLGGLGLGRNFTDADGAFLGTPDELRRGTRQQRVVAGQTGQRATTINYNFGDIKVDSGAAARQAAKEARRLTALNPGARAALDAA